MLPDSVAGLRQSRGRPSQPGETYMANRASPVVTSGRTVTADEAAAHDIGRRYRHYAPPPNVRRTLTEIAVGERPSPRGLAESFEAVANLMPPVRDIALGSLMMAVMTGGPRVGDVVALLRSALSVDERPPQQEITGSGKPVVLLAGSGKKGRRTLNVSTPAALVAVAAGARIIKVGSAATSSALGSRDLVRALGLPECRTAASVRRALGSCGLAFVAIEPEIPILDRLYGGRFYAPNPFSFGLAPLASPVRGDITVFGLSHPRVDVAAQVLREFGIRNVDVVTTRLPTGEYLDEIAPTGRVSWCRARDGRPGSVQVQPAHELAGNAVGAKVPAPSGSGQAVEQVGDLLSGGGLREHRVIVSVNAAHLLMLSGIARSPMAGMRMADDILRSGAASAILSHAWPIEERDER